MNFHLNTSEVFIPDNLPVEQALKRTTHLAISAHQDDIEIMATGPILDCFQQDKKWFSAVVVTDGRGSPRNGLYEHYDDEQMHLVRFKEQRKAAIVGEYASLVMLDYPSNKVKSSSELPVDDLAAILEVSQPNSVYTHNLADKHDTHVGTALKVIAAIRRLPKQIRPQLLIGCEVWRNLDWLLDEDKVTFNVSQQENMQSALLGVFDSQITGGKRYDLASLARRRANATYFESHGVDVMTGLSFGLDLTPLIHDDSMDPNEFIQNYIRKFAQDVTDRLHRLK